MKMRTERLVVGPILRLELLRLLDGASIAPDPRGIGVECVFSGQFSSSREGKKDALSAFLEGCPWDAIDMVPLVEFEAGNGALPF
jgi:hypothetical protein